LLWPTPSKKPQAKQLTQSRPPADTLRSGMQSGLEALSQSPGFEGAAGISAPDSSSAEPPLAAHVDLLGESAAPAGAPSSTEARDSTRADADSRSARAVRRRIRGKQAPVAIPETQAQSAVQPSPDQLSSAQPQQCHLWSASRVAGKWICTVCFRTSRLSEPPRLERCAGLRPKLRQLIADRKQHSLACCDYPNGVIVFCTRCGAVTEGTRLANLSEPCRRAPQSGKAATNLSRIAQGMHPKSKGVFGNQSVLTTPISLDSIVNPD
jgi:hypothetical protein